MDENVGTAERGVDDITLLSRELGRAIDTVIGTFDRRNFEEITEQLHKLEADFALRIGDNSILQKELTRRLVEAQFHAAIAKNMPFNVCKGLFDRMYHLGFTHRHGEVTYHIIFAQFCLKAERFAEGLQLLRPFEEELAKGYTGNDRVISSRDSSIIRNLLTAFKTKTISAGDEGGPALAVTKYIYDGDTVLHETDGAGAALRTYTNDPGGYGDLLSVYDGSAARYFEPDALGSTDALADQSQAVTDRWAYRAFGSAIQTLGTDPTPFTWVGRQGYVADSATGLYFLRARYYDPQTAQFLSVDPIGFAGGDPNLYRYARNNPVVAADPSGLESVTNGQKDLGRMRFGLQNLDIKMRLDADIKGGAAFRRPDDFIGAAFQVVDFMGQGTLNNGECRNPKAKGKGERVWVAFFAMESKANDLHGAQGGKWYFDMRHTEPGNLELSGVGRAFAYGDFPGIWTKGLPSNTMLSTYLVGVVCRCPRECGKYVFLKEFEDAGFFSMRVTWDAATPSATTEVYFNKEWTGGPNISDVMEGGKWIDIVNKDRDWDKTKPIIGVDEC